MTAGSPSGPAVSRSTTARTGWCSAPATTSTARGATRSIPRWWSCSRSPTTSGTTTCRCCSGRTPTRPTAGADMGVVLGDNQYGKAQIRLMKVDRDAESHVLHDLNVSVTLAGDLAAPHLDGDHAGRAEERRVGEGADTERAGP